MNISESSRKFTIYLASYLGVALIGGSIVHVGAFESQSTRYIILGIIGVGLMVAGSLLEASINKEAISIKYFGIATALAVATGFLSGGVQHYLDDPIYAGYLLAIGIVVSYIAFTAKYSLARTVRGVITVTIGGAMILFISYSFLHGSIPHGGDAHSHDLAAG